MAAKSMRKVSRSELSPKAVRKMPPKNGESGAELEPSDGYENDPFEAEAKAVRHTITCICCGRVKYDTYFFTNRTSIVFAGMYNKIPVCKDCLDSLYRSFALKYDTMTSVAAICAIMDLPYNEPAAFTYVEDGNFQIGQYVKTQNIKALSGKRFIDSIQDGEFFDTRDKLRLEVEKLWMPQDKRNKAAVISKLGYDPFENFGFEDTDYRTAFNIMCGYLEDESICQDAHKVQSVITIVVTTIQCNKVESLLTHHYKNINPDPDKIKTLTATKKDLQQTISKLAEDNNISSKYQKENKATQSHLTAKMKEMQAAEYWEAKPNIYDVKTSAAFRQIFDISHKSILSQLELDDSDYAAMVKEQREMIKNLQDKCDKLSEENRNLKNRIIFKESEGGGK